VRSPPHCDTSCSEASLFPSRRNSVNRGQVDRVSSMTCWRRNQL
jgi:hypothetical protein